MKNLDLQQIIVYRNDDLKLAHVAVNNMYTNKGQKNYSASLTGAYNHAKYAMRGAADNPSTEHHFCSSFITRLMNTGLEGWKETQRIEDLSVSQALKIARQIREDLEDLGFDVTGLYRGKSIRNTGVRGITNLVIKNATQRRIFDIVSKLTVGIEGINLVKAQNMIYMQYIKERLNTRREFWYFINENLDTLTK